MFNNLIEWELLNEGSHADFYEDVKRMLRLKRQYASIFDYAPENHREANICKVESDSGLQAYARFRDGTAMLILPNNTDEARTITAVIPFEQAGIRPG